MLFAPTADPACSICDGVGRVVVPEDDPVRDRMYLVCYHPTRRNHVVLECRCADEWRAEIRALPIAAPQCPDCKGTGWRPRERGLLPGWTHEGRWIGPCECRERMAKRGQTHTRTQIDQQLDASKARAEAREEDGEQAILFDDHESGRPE